MTDIVRGTVIGQWSKHYRVRANCFMSWGGQVTPLGETEIMIWREQSMRSEEILESVLADELKAFVQSNGVRVYYVITDVAERIEGDSE